MVLGFKSEGTTSTIYHFPSEAETANKYFIKAKIDQV